MEPDEAIAGYWRLQELFDEVCEGDPALDEFWPAYEAMDEMVEAAEPGIVDFLVRAVDAAPPTGVDPTDGGGDESDRLGMRLCTFGAGPVEDLVRAHGERLVDEIETAARRNLRFRTALRCVWYGDDLDRSVVERLQRIAPPT